MWRRPQFNSEARCALTAARSQHLALGVAPSCWVREFDDDGTDTLPRRLFSQGAVARYHK